jgi:HK97 family phage major capsid protein
VADDTDEPAQWLAEDQPIDLGSKSDFTKYGLECHKLVSVIRLRADQACDIGFNLEDYLVERFSRRFAKAEDNAFINGTGIGQAKGILHSTDGAQTGLTSAAANELTFDEVLSLYFSVDKEYRAGGAWLMNDATALALKKLKAPNGYPLWNQNSGTIMEKKVLISNYMPNIEAGAKPIAFGDFSHYWVACGSRLNVKALSEYFAESQRVGYIGTQFIDGLLIRKDAIKVIKMASEE